MRVRIPSSLPTVRTVLALAAGCLLVPTSADACCKTAPSVEAALATTDAVVVAEVLHIRSQRYPEGAAVGRPYRQMVEVKVLEAMKGAEEGEVLTFWHQGAGTSTSMNLREDQTWLLYITDEASGGCTRSLQIRDDGNGAEELSVLRELTDAGS